jgi:carbon catabolite-derepressing protein kinase
VSQQQVVQQQQQAAAKKSKIRWHFGIRSRSEPLEVMLEIYRTLKTLGFEWKEKEPERRIVMEDYGDEYGETLPTAEEARERGLDRDEMKKRKRKEDEEFIKKAQALYLIEARCRLDDIMIRMDLQLYSIDDDNYLVDFRNLGYRKVKPPLGSSTPAAAGPSKGVSFAPTLEDEERDPSNPGTPLSPNAAGGGSYGGNTPEPRSRQPSIDPTNAGSLTAGNSFTARQLWEAAAKTRTYSHSGGAPQQRPTARRSKRSAEVVGGNVSSPFLFLECACRLIVELGEYDCPRLAGVVLMDRSCIQLSAARGDRTKRMSALRNIKS